MAKKKKKKVIKHPASFSPESYLRKGSARKLPIVESLIPENWTDLKKFPVIVARKHANGNITCVIILVDLLCTGIKDAMYMVNLPEDEYREMVDRYEGIDLSMISCEYQVAHNIIYEALAYAEDFGIEPHTDFSLAEMVLEEDDESIPLMEIPLGENDKPLLVLHPDDPRNDYYRRQLEKHAGPGNYEVVDGGFFDEYGDEEMDDFYPPEEWTREEWEDFLLNLEPDELTIFDPAVYMIYEKCIFEPHMAGKQLAAAGRTTLEETEVTFDAIGEGKYSEEELNIQFEIYSELNSTELTPDRTQKIITRLKNLIIKWPENPILHNYLYTAYIRSGEVQRAEEQTRLVYEKFPDYFFGKIAYANLLIEKKRLEEVPDVFDGEYSLPGLFPDRKQFHISEFTAFHSLMGMYFLAKDDLASAYIYYKILNDIDLPEDYPLNEKFFMEITLMILKEVKSLMSEIQSGKVPLEDMLALLVNG